MQTQVVNCAFLGDYGLQDKILDEKYKILQFIDSGAQGKVFKCQNLDNPSQQLAIKFCFDNKVFLQEIKTLSALQKSRCRSIPKLYDFSMVVIEDFETAGAQTWGYYIMPFYEHYQQNLTPIGVLKVGQQILSSFQALHNIGKTYNDLKHHNIIIERSGKATLIDFGLCQRYHDNQGFHLQEQDSVDSFKGNLIFASPHTLSFGRASRRDDLMSLSYMMIYMLNDNKYPYELEDQINQCGDQIQKLEICLRHKRVYTIKRMAVPENKCDVIKEFVEYVEEMKYQQSPDYQYLQEMLQKAVSKIQQAK